MDSCANTSRTISPVDLIACTAQMSSVATAEELRDVVAEFQSGYGFMGFTFAVVRRVKTVYLHARLLSTWAMRLQSTFEQDQLFNADPVIIRSRTAFEPFAWDMSIYDADNAAHRALLELRATTGIEGGICIPLAEPFQGRCVLYLSGRNFDASRRAMHVLQLLAEHLCVCLNRIEARARAVSTAAGVFQSDGELSPRERQVFGWIAFGKSSKDIALIMGISEHTVNDHIASSVSKLKASNRTEALLRALLTNQIDLS